MTTETMGEPSVTTERVQTFLKSQPEWSIVLNIMIFFSHYWQTQLSAFQLKTKAYSENHSSSYTVTIQSVDTEWF